MGMGRKRPGREAGGGGGERGRKFSSGSLRSPTFLFALPPLGGLFTGYPFCQEATLGDGSLLWPMAFRLFSHWERVC